VYRCLGCGQLGDGTWPDNHKCNATKTRGDRA
jgi:hypothetical protein